MNALIRIVAAAVAAGLLIKLRPWQPYAPHEKFTNTIDVKVSSEGDTITICVSPLVAYVRRGTMISWTHNAKTLTIEPRPKPHQPWPFEVDRPRAARGQPALSGHMRGSAQKDVAHAYTIIAETDTHTIRLDPDIILRDPKIL